MNYFGIKTPSGHAGLMGKPYIWWIAESQHEAWMSFFQYPSAKRELNAHRLPIEEAIRAYEAIGYRCVELDVQEKPNTALTERDAARSEGECCCGVVELRAENALLRGVFEAGRRVLRFNGVDTKRLTKAFDELDAACERVKLLDSGLGDGA